MKYKYSSLPVFILFLFANAVAQPVLKSQRTGGGSLYDYFTCMYLTKDGGLIAGGYSPSNISGEKTQNSRGVDDYWIVKFNSSGNIQWDKTIGGSSYDNLHSLQQTSDGGYILGGSSASNISGEKTQNTRGQYYYPDYWIVKLDSSGNIQWDRTIGGNSVDVLTSLQQTIDGGYILGGYSNSDISGEKTEKNRGEGYQDYWVVKVNSQGNIQWDKTIGGNSNDILRSLQQTSDGGLILGGSSESKKSDEKTENSRGSWDYWIIKLSNSGNIEWDKTIGGSSDDYLSSLQQITDCSYVLGGYSESNRSGEKTENSRGSWDYWIIKLSNSGNIEWDKTIGGADIDNLSSLQQTKDGGYILAGNSYSNISGEKTENSKGSADYWIVKLDSLHNIQWDKTIGGSDYDVPKRIKEAGKDRYVVGGYSISGKSGDKNKASRGGADYWIVALVNKPGGGLITSQFQSGLTIAKPGSNQYNNFSAYPNPANNSITVSYTAQKSSKNIFEIIDMNGRILLHKEINAIQGVNNTTLNVSHFAKGIYFINIIRPDKTKESIRISKE